MRLSITQLLKLSSKFYTVLCTLTEMSFEKWYTHFSVEVTVKVPMMVQIMAHLAKL